MVRAAVLRAYELVPESYCQKFLKTYRELGLETEALSERWCRSKGVDDFDKLCDLMLLEDFKNCVPDRIASYINEQKVSKAAVLAD